MIPRPVDARTQAEALATGWRPRSMGEFLWFCHLGPGLPREALDDPLLTCSEEGAVDDLGPGAL